MPGISYPHILGSHFFFEYATEACYSMCLQLVGNTLFFDWSPLLPVLSDSASQLGNFKSAASAGVDPGNFQVPSLRGIF